MRKFNITNFLCFGQKKVCTSNEISFLCPSFVYVFVLVSILLRGSSSISVLVKYVAQIPSNRVYEFMHNVRGESLIIYVIANIDYINDKLLVTIV